MLKYKAKKSIITPLLILAVALSGGGFYFFHGVPRAEAAKKTKWQKLLENNNVPESYWAKYKPRVSRKEYNKVKDALSGSGVKVSSQAKSKVTKWQRLLERNGVDRSYWEKYLPKISRKEYKKITKAFRSGSGGSSSGSFGPEISVGLWYFEKSEIKSDPFKIDANKTYNIRRSDGSVIAQVSGGTTTRVTYESGGNLKIYSSISETIVDDKVWFDAADGDNSNIIFDAHRPNDSYDHFRGKIEVNYYHGEDKYNRSSATVTQIWVINDIPLEQYVWGMGETTGTGDMDHVRVMTTIFRTYGKWYIENATKYKPLGFTIRSDSGSQIYGGYDWEKDHPHIREAADDTRGKIITYKGDTILAPYCSYTDGHTRPYPYTDRKKKPSKDYPYLKSVKDHKEGTRKNLKPGEGGNHMWGLSAHGALGYAEDGKSWEWILKHYYSGVKISGTY